MTTKIFVPRDAAALSMGADKVAEALATQARQRGLDVRIIRNGSRGMLWLEPLVEVETTQGRVAYGPVRASDVASLFEAGFLSGGDHRLGHGLTEKIPFLARQQRLTFARCGVTDPLSLDDYKAHGGFEGLAKAMALTPAAIVEAVTQSGLRGRGGAAFPTGIKWRTAMNAVADQKYIVCNADEGDSGTYADRMIMEGDPFSLIEGMAIAGLATGATRGYIYIRSEYPHAFGVINEAIRSAESAGIIGKAIMGKGPAFHLEARLGAGAYICGEETSLLDSLEGKRGQVRAKPPLPAISGLFGKPTVINNVISFTSVPWIMAHGASAYADYGMGRSRGTLPVQLAGNIKFGGLFETAFGISLRTLVEELGGGTHSGRPLRAVQIGGPLGAYHPAHQLDTILDYEALAAIKGMVGHGGIVVFDDSVDMARQARFAMEFCAVESCGKCTPCRIGARRGVEVIDKMIAGDHRAENRALLEDLCTLMTDGSLCAMGGLTPLPVMSALTHFPEDFDKPAMPLAAE
ncbi:MAG: formate dehydrogenase [Hyphomicrobiales bacterium]|nr:formate dehydrogenase [Hyphomicrobiales bacterium]